MKTIRRGYFYIVSLISLEVVTWAVIGLIRSIFDSSTIGSRSNELASALSLIVVGVVVFGIHWRIAQREAAQDPEEQFSGVRAVFLYVTFAALLIPVAQNLLSLIYRNLATLFDVEISRYSFGGDQIVSDNIIAIVINAVAAYYIYQLLQAIWAANPSGDAFPLTRRISRYLWMLYSLGLSYAGVNQLISYVLSTNKSIGGAGRSLAWGLAFTIVGMPIWAYVWSMIQTSLKNSDEQTSPVRQVSLYLLTFLGVAITLGSASGVLYELFETLFDNSEQFSDYIDRIAEMLAFGLPAGLVWFYFGRVIKDDREAHPQVTQRSGMRRLYFYILSFMGLGVTFVGIEMVILFVIDQLFRRGNFTADEIIPAILTAFIIGLPLWLRAWVPMNTEAAAEGEDGDHARRSVNRKGYLYLSLFISVIGMMALAGTILFILISALLGDPPDDMGYNISQAFGSLIAFTLLGAYQLRQLRADNQLASTSLSTQHADFSVVVLEPGEGDFAEEVVAAIRVQVKDVPVAVQPIGENFDASLKDASAVVLPSDLAANPPEAVRLWLDEFGGLRVVVPVAAENWVWVGVESSSLREMAKLAGKTIGLLAEGQEVIARARSVWMYVLAGLIGIPILCILINILGELLYYAF